jgi:hypothetical protein
MNTSNFNQYKTTSQLGSIQDSPFWSESCFFPGPQLKYKVPILYWVIDHLQHSKSQAISTCNTTAILRPHLPQANSLHRKITISGFLMLELSLALLISSLAAGLAFWSAHRADMASQAMMQADQLQNIAQAAETLVMEHYQEYQAGQAIIRNGLRLDFGTEPGKALAPTLDQLRGMALGLTAGSNFGSYKSLQNASYLTQIERIPVGCENTASGSSCNISGLVCLDKPVQDFNPSGMNTNTEIDGFGLGKMMGKIGGNAGISLLGSASKITGSGGAWTANNPLNSQPAGIICIRFGFGASAYGQFLRVKDSRDPQFQNNLTTQGNITSINGSIGAGTGTSPSNQQECRLGEIINSGAFFSRSSQCVKRAWVDGNNGEIGLADNNGKSRILLKANGEVLSLDEAGQNKAGFTYEGLNSIAKADQIINNQANAGLRANGESFANSFVLGKTAIAGTSCPTNNAMVWGTSTHHLRLLKCENWVWVASGTSQANVGDACSVNGEIAESPTKVSIICVGNVWQTTTSRMGKFSIMASYLANHGSVINKPACGSGGVAKIMNTPQTLDSRKLFLNFKARDNGSTWTTLITDGDGLAIAGSTLVETGCWYS